MIEGNLDRQMAVTVQETTQENTTVYFTVKPFCLSLLQSLKLQSFPDLAITF